MSTAALEPLRHLPPTMEARGWNLHVEQTGRFARARAAAGEAAGDLQAAPLWVACVTGPDHFVIEADGATPTAALAALWEKVTEHCRFPDGIIPLAAPGGDS